MTVRSISVEFIVKKGGLSGAVVVINRVDSGLCGRLWRAVRCVLFSGRDGQLCVYFSLLWLLRRQLLPRRNNGGCGWDNTRHFLPGEKALPR